MARTVWILGSGFSKPLGGPLLRDLFRQERFEDALAFFPRADYRGLGDSLPWVQFIFHTGSTEGLWDNAEQFLAYVDESFGGQVRQKRDRLLNLVRRMRITEDLLRGSRPDVSLDSLGIPDALDRVVKRALAAECSRFLIGADPKTDELWMPYREWIRNLERDEDTILTFNYDRVVEIAAQATGAPLWVVSPKRPQRDKTIRLLKLHGSVDWRLLQDPNDKSQMLLDEERVAENSLLRSPDDIVAIAAPGGSKGRFVAKYLRPLWEAAEQAVREADRLIIVGYSFPDTDPTVAHRFLNAFAEGSTRHRQAHIVIGEDVRSTTTRKLFTLFRSTSIKNEVKEFEFITPSAVGLQVIPHPLGAQHFIGRHRSFTS